MIENNSTYNYVSVLSVKPILTRLFGIDMQEDDIIENAAIALRKIGNVHYEIFLHRGEIINGIVELPCNVSAIESVTFDDVMYNSYLSSEIFLNSQLQAYFPYFYAIRGFFTLGRLDKSNLYPFGNFTNYSFVDNKIILDYQYANAITPNTVSNYTEHRTLNVIYRGYIADEEGFMKVTEKEALAIAYYCNYLDKQKQAFMGLPLGQTVQLAQQRWLQECVQARIPEHFSQNAVDSILNRLSSFNRKFYNQSYKFNQ